MKGYAEGYSEAGATLRCHVWGAYSGLIGALYGDGSYLMKERCGGDGEDIAGDGDDIGGVAGGEAIVADLGDDGGDGDDDDTETKRLVRLKSSGFVLRFSGSSSAKNKNIFSINRQGWKNNSQDSVIIAAK